MTNDFFLFDTYSVAERTLAPAVLSEAVCAAIRLGRHALEEERQAAFLLPLAQQNCFLGIDPPLSEDLAELLDACVRRPGESHDQFVTRLEETSNLSAIRVTLAQLFQQEYGENSQKASNAAERRKTIRKLCRCAPREVWSDIAQGGLRPEDADFLGRPDFSVLGAPVGQSHR